MYKLLMSLVALVAMALPANVHAQSMTDTVANGTETNSYVPVYGFYADAYLRCQSIYPSTLLGFLNPGDEITSLTFFASTTSVSWGSASFEVKLCEVTATTLSDYLPETDATTVYTGALSIANGKMTVTFTTPYIYMGGNLLVVVNNTVEGSYVSSSFYGVSSTSSSRQGYSYSSLSAASSNQRDFLAKMAITYTPGVPPTCYRVKDLIATGIDSDMITLHWLDTLNIGASYTIDYWSTPTDSAATTTTDTFVTIYNLNAYTLYNFTVTANCSDNTDGLPLSGSFRTACGMVNTPYTTYFDSVSSGALPGCWIAPATSTSGSGTFPSVYNYSSNAYSGPCYLEFESSTGATEILAMPQMANISSLGLSFYASVMNRNFVLEVGVLDDTTFEVVDTINLIVGNGNWHNSYYRYNVFFANYTGNGTRIALRVTGTANSSYTLMMDNFSVQEFSGCYPVTNFSISNVGSTEVTLDWDDNFNSGASYNVYYWTSPTDTLVEIATADSVTITGLSINTVYNFAVEADCGSGNVSTRTVTISTRTLAGDPISDFPYICGFETGVDDNGDPFNEGAVWVIENNAPNSWYTGTAAFNTGSRGLYISNNTTGATNAYTNNTACVSYAHATFNLTAGEYVLSFDWKANGENNYDFLRVAYAPYGTALPTTYSDWGSGATVPTGFIGLDGGQLVSQTTWQTKTTTFTVANSGLYDLYFVWRNDYSSGTNPPAAVDNVQLLRNTCPAPTNFVTDSVGPYDVTFRWSAGGEETEWVIRAIHGNVTDPWQSSTDTTFTYTGLSSETNYTFQLRAVCGANDSSLIVSRTVTTLVTCEAPTNFTANVHGDTATFNWRGAVGSNYVLVYGAAGLIPDTASNPLNMTDTTYDAILTDTGFYDAYVLIDCGGDSSSWVGPASFSYGVNIMNMATTGTDTLRSCAAIIYDNGGPTGQYTTNCNATLVLLPTNPNDMVRISGQSQTEANYDYLTIYEGIGTSGTILFQDNQSGIYDEIPIGPFTADAFTVVFTSDYTVTYDGFMINVSCIAGSDCVRPRNLAVNALRPDSVAVTWNTIDNSAASWEVVVGTPGFNPDTVSSPIAVTDSSYVFTNLVGGTAYEVYVRTDCGNEQSMWIGPNRFTPGSFNMGTVGSATISLCGGVIYDDGGINGDYSYNANYTLTVYPTNTDSMLTFHGTFEYDGGYDHLYIYEGVGTNGTILWQDDGSGYQTIPLDTCTSGPITIQFTSDDYDVYAGFELFVNCVAAPTCSPVVNLESHVTPTAALITWEPGYYGHYTGATVEYKADSAADWTSVGTVTGNFIVIDGLDAVTDYNVRVTTDCDGFTGGMALTNFTTAEFGCAMIDSTMSHNDTVTGTATTGYSVPVNNYYGNTFSEQLYTATDLGTAGTISSFAFKYGYSTPMTAKTNCSVYMANTTLTGVTTSSYVAPETMTLVYSGSLNCTQGWNEFVMTTPFNYTGGTLAVAVVDNSNNYNGSSYVWNCHNISGMTMAWYSDSYTYPNSSMSKTTYTYRPDMIFKFLSCSQQATCAAPAAAVIDVTTTTVTVAWAPGNGEASWNAYYRMAGATAWSAPVAVTGNSYTFTGLNSGRNYEFKVENVCTEGSLTATVDAATLCAQISSLPFTEDFNGWGTGVTPNCWSNAPSYTPTSYGIISGSYNHSGTTGGSVYMYSSSTLTNKTYLILPELDTNVYQPNQLQLVFNLLHISTSYGRPAIEVGVMTDPGNASSFVAIDTVQHSGALNTWEVFEVPMSAYTGNGNYVAMRTAYDSAYSYFYLDDVTLEVIPTCLRPDSLTVSNATTSSVDLAWHERSNATSWVVEYGPSGFQPGTGTSVAASTNPFTLTGLPASYQGEYYVKSVCGAGDTSDYSRQPCAFNTTQIPATLPYNYDFEDSTEWANWQTCSNHTNNWFRGTAVADSGSYSIYMSADSGATYKPYLHNAVVNATAYRDIDFGTIDSSFTMTIRARAGGTTTGAYDGMIVLLADPSVATVPSSGNLMTPWGDVRNLYQIMDVRTDTTWQTYSCSFDTIHGVQRVAFYWFNQNTQGSSSYPNLGEPVAVDNIHIDYSSCPRPVDLQVTPSTTSAMLTWVGPASATYQISYRNINDTTIQNVIVNTNSHNLTGLVSPATYICSVRKICGNDTSFYSDAVRFTTLCAPQQLPFTETFNGVAGTDYSTAGNLPLCWEGYSNGTDNNYFPHVVAAGGSYVFSNDNTNAITLIGANYSTYGTTKVVALPIINADLSTCQISFYYAMENTSYGDLEVGYLTGSNMATDFVPVDTMTRTEDITCDTVSLANVPATALRLAFRWTQTGSSTWYSAGIDNVTVTGQAGPSCEAPTITAVTASDDNATVTWTATHDSCYVAVTSGDWDNSVAGTLVLTGSYNMTDLTPNTNYTVGVRQRCDEGLYSDWITQNFTTADVPCLAVTGLTVVSTGFDNVTVSWVPTSVETAWNVRIYNTTMDTTVRSTDTVCTVTGLIRGVTYNVMVQPLCGSAATIEGPWCEATNFTTVECQPVTNVTTSNITNSSVKLSWTAAGSNDSEWRIEYGYAGFSRGEGQSVTATTNPYTLTGLERNTDYDVYVATVCEGNMLSSWSTVTSFTTDNNEGIDEATGESAVSLYPNPATSTVTIDQTMGRADITVIDMNGRTIGQWQATESSLTIDVSSMSKGTYFVRVTGEQATVVRKLVVK